MDDTIEFLKQLRDKDRARLHKELYAAGVLHSLVPGLVRYFVDRIPTGDFLRSVLESDLLQAFLRGDMDSIDNLRLLVRALHDVDLPQDAFGSKEKVAAWLGEKSAVPA